MYISKNNFWFIFGNFGQTNKNSARKFNYFFLTVLTFLTVSPSNGQSGQSGHVIFLSCTFCTFPLQSAIVQIVQCIFFERCVQKLSVSCSYIFLVIINHYRYHLESILVQIAINQQTKPLKIGRKYILSKDKRSIKIQRNDVQCTKEQIGRLNEWVARLCYDCRSYLAVKALQIIELRK